MNAERKLIEEARQAALKLARENGWEPDFSIPVEDHAFYEDRTFWSHPTRDAMDEHHLVERYALQALEAALAREQRKDETFQTMLAVEREVIKQLRARLRDEEALGRCNALGPLGDASVFCDLWPHHDGPHMNAAGVEWKAAAVPGETQEAAEQTEAT